MNERFQHVNKTPTVEIRKNSDGTKTLTGYAAVFDSLSEDLGGFREVIRKGAFDESLAENPDVSARIQHMGGLSTIGRTTNGTLRLSTDKKGLKYEVDLPDTSAARDIYALVSRGDIDKSSFAFSLRNDGDQPSQEWFCESDPPTRELLRVNLHDVAPVDGPAYMDTTVSARALEQAKKTHVPVPRKTDAELKAEYHAEIRERIAAFLK